MNNKLKSYAKQEIINGLKKCTELQVYRFKLMYSLQNTNKAVETIVNSIPEKKLDWALSQVDATVVKNSKKGR